MKIQFSIHAEGNSLILSLLKSLYHKKIKKTIRENDMYKNLIPTEIFTGTNSVIKNAKELIIGKCAFIVTGKSSGEKSGALSDVKKVLSDNNISYTVYDKIGNNPTLEEAAEGGCAARKSGADFIIGIGGGSPLDASKAIAVFATNDFSDNYDLFKGEFENMPLPMVAIPTTAGTGSEATPYSILTVHKEKNKKNFSSPNVFYKKAFIDGRYNFTLPLQVARNTFVDTLCHLIEGYTDKRASDKTDKVIIYALEILSKHKDVFIKGKFNIKICEELLFASMLGGAVISHTGTTIIHSMGYPLTYYKDIPHGRANGIILSEYLRRTEKVLPEKIENILKALKFSSVEKFSEYLKSILPVSEQFSLEEVREWTKTTILSKNVLVCPFDVDYDTEVEIFKICLGL